MDIPIQIHDVLGMVKYTKIGEDHIFILYFTPVINGKKLLSSDKSCFEEIKIYHPPTYKLADKNYLNLLFKLKQSINTCAEICTSNIPFITVKPFVTLTKLYPCKPYESDYLNLDGSVVFDFQGLINDQRPI